MQASTDTLRRVCSDGMVFLPLSMPRTPKGHKRPADVISNAVQVMKLATGEAEESVRTDDGRIRAAVELGRLGGQARAKALSQKRKVSIARHAAKARWKSD